MSYMIIEDTETGDVRILGDVYENIYDKDDPKQGSDYDNPNDIMGVWNAERNN